MGKLTSPSAVISCNRYSPSKVFKAPRFIDNINDANNVLKLVIALTKTAPPPPPPPLCSLIVNLYVEGKKAKEGRKLGVEIKTIYLTTKTVKYKFVTKFINGDNKTNNSLNLEW